jgi:hypothetical protein
MRSQSKQWRIVSLKVVFETPQIEDISVSDQFTAVMDIRGAKFSGYVHVSHANRWRSEWITNFSPWSPGFGKKLRTEW